MVIKNGKHRLVGFVDLGPLHDDMQKLEGQCALFNYNLHFFTFEYCVNTWNCIMCLQTLV